MRRFLKLLLLLGGSCLLFYAGYLSSARSWFIQRPAPVPATAPDPTRQYLQQLSEQGTSPRDLDLVNLAALIGEQAGKPGRWMPAGPLPLANPKPGEPDFSAEETALLLSVPYLQGYERAAPRQGITVHDRSKAWPGLNLYSSGHDSRAFLADMDGHVLHEWHYDFQKLIPGFPDHAPTHYFRRVHLLEGGDLLAIYDSLGIIRLDRDSNLRWALMGGIHHALFVTGDGVIHTLLRKAHVLPRFNAKLPILEDFLVEISPDGRKLREISLLQCFLGSNYAPLVEALKPTTINDSDLFHTNSIQVFDGALAERSPLFQKGNVLISLRNLNLIAIVDPEQAKVLWALSGLWLRQHEPVLLPSGRILLFDNLGNDGSSRVLEFDPFSQQVFWNYTGHPGSGLTSYTMGSVQRLPNGNTLITESDRGRALEVTSGNELVWEMLSPYRTGKNDELVATLCEVLRIDAAQLPWLPSLPEPKNQ